MALFGNKNPSYKHGKRNSAEYNTWRSIKKRCYKLNNASYKDYGGRGITMCDRWFDSFENFFADIGPRPSPKHSIDRIDVNGNYEPSNCRWATVLQQVTNKRRKPNTGVTGIMLNEVSKKFRVYIMCKKQRFHVGCFKTLEDAIEARKEAEQKYWGDNNDKAVNN